MKAGGRHSTLLCHIKPACWLELILFFDPEDGGDKFHRNVGCNSTDYMASYPRRQYFSTNVGIFPKLFELLGLGIFFDCTSMRTTSITSC
jgi:hypothetical protein